MEHLKITDYVQSIGNLGTPAVYRTQEGELPVPWVEPLLAAMILLGGIIIGVVVLRISR